ncbi:fluoride efflux transporter CrcB [Luteococcus sp. H138]|uniref:fluoride efflux transporter CrcB n=1 Tax=unclassified Luteococcus TaxID=2639923 RepID=UPI00313A7CC8
MNLVLMALLGGVGATARFVVDALVRARRPGSFPLGTLLINLLGSLLLGMLTAATLRDGMDPDVKLVLGTGFCGGFTTFSTASVEVVRLVQQGRAALALAYLLGGAAGCLAMAGTGFWLLA